MPVLRELKGPDYHNKKNLLNQFRKKTAHRYLPLTPALVTEAIRFQHE